MGGGGRGRIPARFQAQGAGGGGSVVLVPDRVSYHAEEEGGGDSELRSKDVENAIFLKWDISRIVLSFLLA